MPYQQFNFFTLLSDVARDLDKTTSSVSVHIITTKYYIKKL
jgi:hypothetical protein